MEELRAAAGLVELELENTVQDYEDETDNLRIVTTKAQHGHAGVLSLAMLLAAALVLMPAAMAQTAADPVVARRGDLSFTASQVREMLRNADPAVRAQLAHDPQAMATYVRDRMLQLSVLGEAHDHQWDTRPDVVWRADRAREASIADSYVASLSQPNPSYPNEAEIQAAYEANKARLMLPRQYHLAQIYLAVPPTAGASADVAAQRKLAELRTQATRGRADFTTLARRLSEDHASGTNGGDLGWLREDQMLPAVRAAVASLSEGSISEPVRAGDGWHLLRLIGTKPAGPAALADVHAGLVRALRQQRAQRNAQAYISGLLKTQPIEINEIELAGLTPR